MVHDQLKSRRAVAQGGKPNCPDHDMLLVAGVGGDGFFAVHLPRQTPAWQQPQAKNNQGRCQLAAHCGRAVGHGGWGGVMLISVAGSSWMHECSLQPNTKQYLCAPPSRGLTPFIGLIGATVLQTCAAGCTNKVQPDLGQFVHGLKRPHFLPAKDGFQGEFKLPATRGPWYGYCKTVLQANCLHAEASIHFKEDKPTPACETHPSPISCSDKHSSLLPLRACVPRGQAHKRWVMWWCLLRAARSAVLTRLLPLGRSTAP